MRTSSTKTSLIGKEAAEEVQFRDFADSMPHIIWTAGPDGSLHYVNKVYREYTGLTLDLALQNWTSVLHPDDVSHCLATWGEAIATGNDYSIEFRIHHKETSEYRWNAVSAKPARNKTGEITKWHGIATDIHERKVADERAASLSKQLDATHESMSDGLIMLDAAGRVSFVNSAMAKKVLRRPKADLLGEVIWETFPTLVTSSLFQEGKRAAEERRAVEKEFFSTMLDRWFEVRIYPSEDCVSVYARDITARKAAEAEVQRLAFHDQLTGLPNRQLLHDRLEHAMAVSRRTRRLGAIMMVDLDNFKALNDTQGHLNGDLFLQEVGARLPGCLRDIDTVARFGGDEFVVLLEDLGNEAAEAAAKAELIGKKILAAVSRPWGAIAGQQVHTATIGVALLDGEIRAEEELYKRADMAMYRGKAAGRNTICFYDPAMQAAVNEKIALERCLRESIQNHWFSLHYQPLVDEEQRIRGAEALLRCSHPAYKNISPAVFIPIAEETGLILEMGQWVLQAACTKLVEWAGEADTAELTLSVNISARQFHHPRFVGDVLEILEKTGANPQRLKLELTETMLLKDMEDAVAKMRALKDCGVRFSLDDFGTGYSSLSYLRHLPLDQLKIDRSFISRVPGNVNDAAIVQAIIAMGHNLGLNIIAEGVETALQHQFLAALDCDGYQGYLFSRPLPEEQFAAYCKSRSRNPDPRTGA